MSGFYDGLVDRRVVREREHADICNRLGTHSPSANRSVDFIAGRQSSADSLRGLVDANSISFGGVLHWASFNFVVEIVIKFIGCLVLMISGVRQRVEHLNSALLFDKVGYLSEFQLNL